MWRSWGTGLGKGWQDKAARRKKRMRKRIGALPLRSLQTAAKRLITIFSHRLGTSLGNREWEQRSKHSFSLSSLYILFLLIERILCSQEDVRKRKNGFVMRFFAPAIFRLMGTGMGTEWEQDGNRHGNKPPVFGKKRRWGLLPRCRMTACSHGLFSSGSVEEGKIPLHLYPVWGPKLHVWMQLCRKKFAQS